ncbi:MAG: group II intron reverse transcriptase, partial [Microcystaceae cyanobacterium]
YEGSVGFDFLGFNIRQHPVGKHQSGCNGQGKKLGFKTIIKPSKKAIARHIESIRNIIQVHKSAPQAALISQLNPIIRGWCNYYSTVCSKSTFRNCKNIIWSQLRAWARYRTGNFSFKTLNKYWHYIEGRLTFSTKSGISLMVHSDTTIKRHVKVKKDKSYFDGDVLYWSTRKGAHPTLPNRVALLLKKYKGRCPECGLMFVADDLIEVDHIIAKEDRGKDKFDNLQPLHRHCHDVKTAHDKENRKALERDTELKPIENYSNEQSEWYW